MFGQKKVVGSIVGGRADMDTMLKLSAAEGIKPMIELMPLSKVGSSLWGAWVLVARCNQLVYQNGR